MERLRLFDRLSRAIPYGSRLSSVVHNGRSDQGCVCCGVELRRRKVRLLACRIVDEDGPGQLQTQWWAGGHYEVAGPKLFVLCCGCWRDYVEWGKAERRRLSRWFAEREE